MSPALTGRFLTTVPPGKSLLHLFKQGVCRESIAHRTLRGSIQREAPPNKMPAKVVLGPLFSVILCGGDQTISLNTPSLFWKPDIFPGDVLAKDFSPSVSSWSPTFGKLVVLPPSQVVHLISTHRENITAPFIIVTIFWVLGCPVQGAKKFTWIPSLSFHRNLKRSHHREFPGKSSG